MPTYFDHNASSPMHPEVLEAIMPYLGNTTGNASSLHSPGRLARSAIELARQQVAELINCAPESVIFTSGGTEANNLVFKGYADSADSNPIISSEIEHPSVLQPLAQLQQSGYAVIRLKVNALGQVDLEAAQEILQQHNPQIFSVMLANNETGVLQPVQQLVEMIQPGHCLTHTDASQAAGKLPIDMRQLGVDALTLAAHKFQGPQGIGALIANRKPGQVLISGGEQEKNRRAGTENVAMIVGMGKAAQIAALELQHKRHHLSQLREVFESRLATISGVVIFGQDAERLPNTTYFSLPYYYGETLLMELDRAGFSLASGSACHSEVTKASHVLSAMGVDDSLALNAIRASFGMSNTLQEVDAFVLKLQDLINKLPSIIRQAAV
ncbi:MAG: cysteine desulfurase family protein [Gammaproteobacteria bacterium]|nr:cysteine desulfurase family protein [Gammaproteobacteria bacterium]